MLDFYFADQLHDVEVAGFDIANFFGDIMAALDPARETKRLTEAATARDRAAAARKAHPRYSLWLVDPDAELRNTADESRNAILISQLSEVETLLQTRNYETAETRLKALLLEHPGDPRLLFTLGQTASLWARDTTDDDVQSQRIAPWRITGSQLRRRPPRSTEFCCRARTKRWAGSWRSSNGPTKR